MNAAVFIKYWSKSYLFGTKIYAVFLRNEIKFTVPRKLNGSRKTSLSESLSQTEQLTVSDGHAAGLDGNVKINVYTLFIKRAKRVEIKLSLFYFESFQYQKFSHPVRRRVSRLRSRVIFWCRRFSLFYTDLFFVFFCVLHPCPLHRPRRIYPSCRSQCFFTQWKWFRFSQGYIFIALSHLFWMKRWRLYQ